MDKKSKEIVTWDIVKNCVNKAKTGLTNSQIADLLNADQAEVSQLTRLIYKAYEIDRVDQKKVNTLAHIYIAKAE